MGICLHRVFGTVPNRGVPPAVPTSVKPYQAAGATLAGSLGRTAVRFDIATRTGGHATPTEWCGASRGLQQAGPCGPRPGRTRTTGRFRAAVKHPRLMPYRRLMLAVLVANLALLVVQHLRRGDWHFADGGTLAALSALALVNVAAAVLIRQQVVLNVLYGLAGRGSPSWPLWVRWSVSKVHHVGGIHAGCAIAGTAWLCAFAVVAIVTCAPPSRDRHAHHARAVRRLVGAAGRRDGVCHLACAHPRPQRVRADASLGWVDGDRCSSGCSPSTSPLRARRRPRHARCARVGLARVGARRADAQHRVAMAAVAPRPDHGAPSLLPRGHRPPRLRGAARHTRRPSASAVGPLEEWHAFATVTTPGSARLPLGHLPGRRLDRPLHRRPADPRLGARRPGRRHRWPRSPCSTSGSSTSSRAAGSDRASDRSSPTACRRGSCGPRAIPGPPTATRSSTRSSAAQPDAVIWDTTSHGQARPLAARPRRLRRLRRRSRVRRQQQDHHATPRPRTRAARDPSLRAHLGLLTPAPDADRPAAGPRPRRRRPKAMSRQRARPPSAGGRSAAPYRGSSRWRCQALRWMVPGESGQNAGGSVT